MRIPNISEVSLRTLRNRTTPPPQARTRRSNRANPNTKVHSHRQALVISMVLVTTQIQMRVCINKTRGDQSVNLGNCHGVCRFCLSGKNGPAFILNHEFSSGCYPAECCAWKGLGFMETRGDTRVYSAESNVRNTI